MQKTLVDTIPVSLDAFLLDSPDLNASANMHPGCGVRYMFKDEAWWPVCAEGFTANNHGATLACQKMGYAHGEVVHDYSGPALDVELVEGAVVLGASKPRNPRHCGTIDGRRSSV